MDTFSDVEARGGELRSLGVFDAPRGRAQLSCDDVPVARTTGRIVLAGVPIDRMTITDVQAEVARGIVSGRGGVIVTPNLQHVRLLRSGHPMVAVFQRAALVLADSTPLVWTCHLAGTPLPERVPGSDLIWALPAVAARIGASIAFIGGRPGSAEHAAARLQERYPGLEIAGTCCPVLGFENDPEAVEALVEEISGWSAGIVFVGLGAPKQELLMHQLAESHPGTWFLGVGGAIDMVAGIVRRAPRWTHRSGLEWAYRLMKEPRRLYRRYLFEGLPCLFSLLGWCLWDRISSHHHRAGSSAVTRALQAKSVSPISADRSPR